MVPGRATLLGAANPGNFPLVADVAMTASEIERRVAEFSAMVERQRYLVEQLEKDAGDATSAKIIFDSLRVSLSLYIGDRHRARCVVEPEQSEAAPITLAACIAADREREDAKISEPALKPKPIFGIGPVVALRGRRNLMPVKSGFLKVISQDGSDEVEEHLEESPVASDDSVQKKTVDQQDAFVFRPLTEEEKNEFMNSFSVKGKKLLAELMGKESSSKPDAA